MQTKKTKIVGTIGPATNEVKTLVKLIKAGLNVARLNFSHGDHAEKVGQFKNVRKASKEAKMPVAILQDLSGPKIRTGDFEDGELVLKKGTTVEVTTKKVLGNYTKFTINYKNLLKDVKVGQRILINDGKQCIKVLSVGKDSLKAKVLVGGKMRSRRGVNLPDSFLSISAITPKDIDDLKFGIKQGVDLIALSFVQTSKDITDLKEMIKKAKSKAMVIAKIETIPAVENLDSIISVVDGVMVARGDLAVEVGPEKVPAIQRNIISKCNNAGKPVIVATQMMESMINSPVPTRAEVSDVSNAIYSGADAVMLSEETAMGSFPVETVKSMAEVARETEAVFNHESFVSRSVAYGDKKDVQMEDAISRYAAKAAYDINAKAIVVLTETGKTSRMVSSFKPRQNIYVYTASKETFNQTVLSFGATPVLTSKFTKITDVVVNVKKELSKSKIIKKGDNVVLVAGIPFGKSGGTNTIHTFKA